MTTRGGGALRGAVARVGGPGGVPVGAGVLVTPEHVVTCAHVVNEALGRRGDERDRPGEPVFVDFPLIGSGPPRPARVTEWWPIAPDGSGDVAVLRPDPPPRPPAGPARLVTTRELWGHAIRAYGFPVRHDHGAWATGRLRDRTAVGWLQVDDERGTGFTVQAGFSGTPVWDDDVQGVVGIAVAAEAGPGLRTSYVIPSGTLVDLWPALRPWSLPPCPYRGLAAFREEDAPVFFGRGELAADIATRVPRGPALALVGPSGSGKTSLVRAGVVPLLRRRTDLAVAAFRPAGGSTPLAALAAALLPLLEPGRTEAERLGEVPKLAAVLRAGGLDDTVHRALERARAHRLVLIIDQFEELMAQEQESAAALLTMTGLADGATVRRIHALITLRSDFLDPLLDRFHLADGLRSGIVPVGPLPTTSLRQVVEGPLTGRTGVAYEAGLVERILRDCAGQPGALPLLEFTLTLLWETQREGVLTHDAYERLGGATGALAAYAERVYGEDLDDSERPLVRRLFTQLVRPGPEGRHTRRIVPGGELPDGALAVAQRLATTRLVVAGRTAEGVETTELAHEALIGHWDRLRGWITEDMEFRTWQDGLRQALARWKDGGEHTDDLLRGAPLREAGRWSEERGADLLPAERAYVDASHAHWIRARRVRRGVTGSIAVLVAAALVLGSLFVYQRRAAADRAAVAASRALAATADSNSRSLARPTATTLLSVAAYRTRDTPEAYANLLARYIDVHDFEHIVDTPEQQTDVQLAPDRTWMAVTGKETIALWDLRGERPLKHDLTVAGFTPYRTAISPDGQRFAAADLRSRVIVWRPAASSVPVERHITLPPQGGATTDSLAFTGDGTLMAGRSDGRIVDTSSGRTSDRAVGRVLGRGPGPATLTVEHDGQVSVWDRRTGASGGSFAVKETQQLVSADGRTLTDVTCEGSTADRPGLRVAVRDLASGRLTRSFDGDGFDCPDRRGIRLDAQGRHLVVSTPTVARLFGYYPRTNLSVWDLTTGRLAGMRVLPVRGLKWIAAAAATGPSELLLVIDQVTSLGTLRFRLDALESLPENTTGVRVSPKRHLIAALSTGLDRRTPVRLRLWDPPGQRTVSANPDAGNILTATSPLLFTPDERHLVTTTGQYGEAAVWSVPGLKLEHRLTLPKRRGTPPPSYPVGAAELAVDSEGRLLVSSDGIVSRWDIRTGRMTGRPVVVQATEGIATVVEREDITPRLAARADAPEYATAVKGASRIEIRDSATGAVRKAVRLPGNARVGRLSYSGNLLHALTTDGSVRTWDAADDYVGRPVLDLGSSGEFVGPRRFVQVVGEQLEIWDLVDRTRERAIRFESSLVHMTDDARVLVYEASFGDTRFVGSGRRESIAVVPLDPRVWTERLCRVTARTALTPQEARAAPAEAHSPAPCA
ncbi:nSTAND1 domain-containing NTPase [Streptomyces hesseae]|uniref:Trypsin-like peptidase domain-containing protein n=1 Tax=Streptomyces hesseae TaxID=3075519 RepID=A0ABU2SFU4_9ACTN|nr:trypsin-like peptidase domain-containing protein [Streptomyces sp. DSM 40473]MDT0447648.1 trypsin-like peptidase domain-containing protein [Streptomyces sp. DSM 40473]